MKEILDIVLKRAKKPLDLDGIYSRVEECLKEKNSSFFLKKEDKEEIFNLLKTGVLDYEYIKYDNLKYQLLQKSRFRKGVFHGNRNGEGYLSSISSYTNSLGEEVFEEEKISISKDQLNGAIDGDLILVDKGGNGVKPKVIKIIDRNLDNIVGEIYRVGNSYFVKPVDKRKQFLTIALVGTYIEGTRVSVKLNEKTSDNFYIGEVSRVFNHKDDPDDDVLWEAFKCGIDDQFSNESLEQVKDIPMEVRDIDKVHRADFTNWEIFTIDGVDTKDIDDAVSLKKLKNGNYLLGVHIADVSYYVPENSPLDRDAFKRGNSNYLLGKVIPMLPHELSNGICSLNPNVERLALSCIMEIDPKGIVVRHSIMPSVIKSSLKMDYNHVNSILKEKEIPEEYKEFAPTLKMMNHLALLLRKNRIQNGAVEFLRPEVKLVFDEDKQVVDFSLRKQDLAENLIEEFMLICNETVDKHLTNRGFPCLHRVHDKPNKERMDAYFELLSCINMPYKKYNSSECCESTRALQELAEYIRSTGRVSNMLSSNLIKCMSRARYSPINIGHRGLAKDYYCHYTSPIRRYADLTIHRLIKDSSSGVNSMKKAHNWNIKLGEIGLQVSKMEKIADEAEISTMQMKCAEYMEKHIGEEFLGTVVGISDHGLHVELDNMVEGRVRVKNMDGEFVYNPTTYTLLSLDHDVHYSIGDRLKVKVESASKYDKTIDFSILEKIDEVEIIDSFDSNRYVKNNAILSKIIRQSHKKLT
ncbi:MAG: VacB/RNase II family 3'-5' exoribonuclease [Bacilli bacterium]|nr:VacB/RNase II family 3'-5' exoribonuclease [Bacilli bacterium]